MRCRFTSLLDVTIGTTIHHATRLMYVNVCIHDIYHLLGHIPYSVLAGLMSIIYSNVKRGRSLRETKHAALLHQLDHILRFSDLHFAEYFIDFIKLFSL